jgi:predicted nucleic acid-binding protein
VSVYADTNAHFPYYLSDLLLWLSFDGVIRLLWSEYMLNELERVIARQRFRRGRVRQVAAVQSQWAAVRGSHLAKDEVPRTQWEPHLIGLRGPDTDDYPHMAAAIAGGASVLITYNLKDFKEEQFTAHGIVVATPDNFLCDLLEREPEVVLAMVRDRFTSFNTPTLTYSEYLNLLSNSVPKFSAKCKILRLPTN